MQAALNALRATLSIQTALTSALLLQDAVALVEARQGLLLLASASLSSLAALRPRATLSDDTGNSVSLSSAWSSSHIRTRFLQREQERERTDPKWKLLKHGARLNHFFLSSFNLATFLPALIYVFSLNPSITGTKTCGMLFKALVAGYTLSLQQTYLLMIKYLDLVTVLELSAFHKKLHLVFRVVVLLFLIIIFLPLAWVVYNGEFLEPTGVCSLLFQPDWLYFTLSVPNFLISFAFFYLFVHPLREFTNNPDHASSPSIPALTQQTRRCAILVTVSTLSAFVASSLFVVASYLIGTNPDYEYVNLIALVFGFFDVSVSTICSKLMHPIWISDSVKIIMLETCVDDTGVQTAPMRPVQRPGVPLDGDQGEPTESQGKKDIAPTIEVAVTREENFAFESSFFPNEAPMALSEMSTLEHKFDTWQDVAQV